MHRQPTLLLATLWLLSAAAWPSETAGDSRSGQITTVRPSPEGSPTPVSLALLFVDVVEIDDLHQQFQADVFFRMRWSDPRLALADQNAADRLLPLGEVWHPQPGSLNRRDVDLSLPQVVRIDPRGEVTYTQRIYGSFAVPMDLHRFPGDTQALAVRLVSYRYSPAEVEFQIDSDTGLLGELSLTGWQISLGESDTEPVKVGGLGREFAGATFRLVAARDASYYVLTMVLPLLFIAAMAWAVFWIDPSVLPPRIAISTASVFSLIAFRFSLKLSLPKISYLTDMDWFVLAVTALVFGAFGHVVLVGRLAKTGRPKLAMKVDRLGRWAYPLLLGALVLINLL